VAKPQPKQIPSDTCAVRIGGETYYPHEGEWIEVLPSPNTLRETQAFVRFGIAARNLEATEGDDDQVDQTDKYLEQDFGVLLEIVAKRVIAWNWTDMRGRPLPQLDAKADLLRDLSDQEVYWLVLACRGEPPQVAEAAEKKDSATSPTTSSATEPLPIPTPSSMARSRTKAS
jgi:hypothetical protein